MAAADLDAGHVDHGILRMEGPVCKFIRLLYVHDLVDAAVDLEQSRIDQSRVSDTADDRHLRTAHHVRVQSAVLYKVFYA